VSQAIVYKSGHEPETQTDVDIARPRADRRNQTNISFSAYVRRLLINRSCRERPHSQDRGREPATLPNVGSMIFTLILKNERRESLLYLRVVTVLKLLRLVGQALEMGPWTHIEISTG
jgi:hypothetical protein